MKIRLRNLTIVLCLVGLSGRGQNGGENPLPPPTPYQTIERSANSRVWERTVYERAPDGRNVSKKHQIVEMATGMHYLQDGQWVESREQIDILPQGGGAAATRGPYQVYFPADIYQGVIEMVTPGGEHLKSHPLGLSYFDGTNSVLIAELTNSVGVLVASNQIIYPNAFTDFKADLRCTYRKGGFECDLVFREQPPMPEQFGLNSAYCQLQLLTEFFDAPEPVQTPYGLNPNDGLSDTTLTFDKTTFVPGKAFAIGNENPQEHISVYKSWQHLNERTFLVEELPLRRIQAGLLGLPSPGNLARNISPGSVLHKVSSIRLLPPIRVAQTPGTNVIQVAKAGSAPTGGVVLDYTTMDSDQTDFVFQGDATYYITAELNLYGTTTLEGGTTIKFDSGGVLDLAEDGKLICKTGPYRPAIFTSMNDDSVGEVIDGSSGAPYFEDVTRFLIMNTTNTSLHDCRFTYCYWPLVCWTYPGVLDIRDCQFMYVNSIISTDEAKLHNVLIHEDDEAPHGTVAVSHSLVAEQVTSDGGTIFTGGGDGAFACITNCILITRENLAVIPTLFTNNVLWLTSPVTPIFQTVKGGHYYLTNGSPYRNAGTTNINPTTLADIRTKTTYPPVVYADTNFSTATNFSMQVQRDTDAPDLGYHYDPLDYIFGNVEVYSNITFNAGTAVGWYWTDGAGAIHVAGDTTANFNGTATAPDYWVRIFTVQEQENYTGGAGAGGMTSAGDGATINLQFTRCTTIGGGDNAFRDEVGHLFINANNCEFYQESLGAYYVNLYVTNCLFDRTSLAVFNEHDDAAFTMVNCTMISRFVGSFWIQHWDSTFPVYIANCTFEDGVFDGVYDTVNSYFDYNAFNTTTQLPDQGTNNLTLTNGFNWKSSWFGNFYLPTNSLLIGGGNTNANLLGLYHFTTQTNQVKETNSMVDIGYHYVATDSLGHPIDTDGDGVADYLEDSNGNGVLDITDLGDWLNPFGSGSTTFPNGMSIFVFEPKPTSHVP